MEEVVVTASRGDGVVFPCKYWTGDEDKVTVEHVQGTEAEVPLGESIWRPFGGKTRWPLSFYNEFFQ